MLIDEAKLIRETIDGDVNAFTQLVEAYQRPVYNLCLRMLGNAEDAEDAAQEAFLRAYQSLKRYDSTRPFSTWLLSIAAHHCIDQIRRRRYGLISLDNLPGTEIESGELDIETKLSHKEQRKLVQQVLSALDGTDRAAVVMYYWNDLSYAEIAQALSLTESAVKSRLHRARKAMAQRWLEEQPMDWVAERIAA